MLFRREDSSTLQTRKGRHRPRTNTRNEETNLNKRRVITRVEKPSPKLYTSELPLFPGDGHETQYFQYFRTFTASSLAGALDFGFWTCDTLQASHMYPALWHATIALGAVHVQLNIDGIFPTRWPHESGYHGLFALKQCTKSIHSLTKLTAQKELSEQDKIVLLTTCVLFSCLSSLQGYQEQAFVHIQSGLKLIRDWGLEEMHLQQRAPPMISMLLLMFNQLDTQERYTRQMMESTPDKRDKFPLIMPHLSVGSFTSYFEAYVELERLINGFSRIGTSNEGKGASRDQQTVIQWKQIHSQALDVWDTRFSHFLATTSEQLSENMMTLLRIRRLFMSTRFNDSTKGELGYDEFVPQFGIIIDLIERLLGSKDTVTVQEEGSSSSSSSPPPQNTTQPHINISLSIIVSEPLIFTGSRCREPSTRRRAVRLLKMYPRREGIVNGISATKLVEAMISFEENACPKMQSGSGGDSNTASDTCSTAGRWICSKHRIGFEEFLHMSTMAHKHTLKWKK